MYFFSGSVLDSNLGQWNKIKGWLYENIRIMVLIQLSVFFIELCNMYMSMVLKTLNPKRSSKLTGNIKTQGK